MYDFVVVGAGFAGSVLAERIANRLGRRVLVVEKRPHVGGCAHDVLDEHGVLIHQYGPHVIHTNDRRIVDYLSRFTAWRHYEHRAVADLGSMRVPIPINRDTINRLYDLNLRTERETRAFYASVRVPMAHPANAREAILAQAGWDLYETFFHGYSLKQWGVDPAELQPAVTRRIPLRANRDDRYFTDTYQLVPRDGYGRMFERMLDHPRITVLVNTDFHHVAGELKYAHLIYTGPIDRYFDYRYGRLPYRSVRFVFEHHAHDFVLPVGQVNYPGAEPFTRVTETKRMTGQACSGTTITYEYPAAPIPDADDLYYPIPTDANRALYARYRRDARREPAVTFCGRLAEYRYHDMDQIVARSLWIFEHRIANDRTAIRCAADEEY